jgi:hypothetical protein
MPTVKALSETLGSVKGALARELIGAAANDRDLHRHGAAYDD